MAYDYSDDEVRMLGVAAPVILRMLQARMIRITNRMCGEFRNNKLDQTANLAELCSVRDQVDEIKTALKLRDTKE